MSGGHKGEFDLIERYFARARKDRSVLVGIGDDAAIVNPSLLSDDSTLAMATDTIVAGVHFPQGTDPRAIAHRALAVNLSDLAAMSARPCWWLLALTLPEADEHWVSEFADAALALAEKHSVCLVGGDLTRGPLTITVQAIGLLEGRRALTRAGAADGDDIYVTGHPGDAAAGLALLSDADAGGNHDDNDADGTSLKHRFLYPEPRIEAGLALAGIASSAIDVSDGLAADLGHICAASGLGAVVDAELLPLSAPLTRRFERMEAEQFAMTGGDDYELVFTASASAAEAVAAAFDNSPVKVTRIGSIVQGEGVVFRRQGHSVSIPASGYRHF